MNGESTLIHCSWLREGRGKTPICADRSNSTGERYVIKTKSVTVLLYITHSVVCMNAFASVL